MVADGLSPKLGDESWDTNVRIVKCAGTFCSPLRMKQYAFLLLRCDFPFPLAAGTNQHLCGDMQFFMQSADHL